MKNTIDEIEGLLARATPQPWLHDADDTASQLSGAADVYINDAEWGGTCIAAEATCADAKLIVALRNAAPDLIAVVRAAAKVAAHPRWERSEDHGLAEALARLGVKP